MVEEELTEKDFIDGIYSFSNKDVNFESSLDEHYIKLDVKENSELTWKQVLDSYEELRKYNANAKKGKEAVMMVNLKHASVEKKAEIIKGALQYDNLADPLMLLNILNLVKVYNTLDDTYFQSEDIFVNSVEELLDLKLAIVPELKEFSKKIAIYFFGLVKSYSKIAFTPADEHIELPNIFKQLFQLLDLATISSILAKSAPFATTDITYVDNAYVYLSSIISRSNVALDFIEEFYQGQEVKEEDVNSNK